jgi:putative DNA primase/helicase
MSTTASRGRGLGHCEQSQALFRHAQGSQAAPRLKAMIELAETERSMPVLPEQLDTDPWLLNVRNGTLDLRTGTLRAHRREDLITKVAPVEYDPMATCPTWEAFLARIMGGNDAPITFLQRAVGYALTGTTTEQVLFFLYGTGANGKSTFLETIRAVLGPFAMQADFTTFLHQKYERVRNDIARLQGARVVASVEAEIGQRLSESIIKQLTGQDRISARFLYQEYFEFTPQFKLFLAANHKPSIWGTDEAIWRRIQLIPFTVTIPAAERDGGLPSRLQTELPGILNWALAGCLDWQRQGLGTPQEVVLATAGYRKEMDIVGGFLDDCCEHAPAAQTSTQRLYDVYIKWCERNGEPVMGKNAFSVRLRERGFTKVRCNNHRGWRGLLVKAEWDSWGE